MAKYQTNKTKRAVYNTLRCIGVDAVWTKTGLSSQNFWKMQHRKTNMRSGWG